MEQVSVAYQVCDPKIDYRKEFKPNHDHLLFSWTKKNAFIKIA